MSDTSGKSRTVMRLLAVVLAAGNVGLFVLSQATPEPGAAPPATAGNAPPRPPGSQSPQPAPALPAAAPPHPSLIALLDGLDKGQQVQGWTVAAFYPAGANQNFTRVEFQKGDVFFSVGIGRKGTHQGSAPPFETEQYEIGFGHQHGGPAANPQRPEDVLAMVPGNEMLAVTRDVADRVRKREKDVPLPPGI